MSTIIDTLIVKLGLDPKDLTAKGQAAVKQMKGLESETTKVEKSGKEATKSLDDLTRGLGRMFAVIGGSYAIKSFITDTINQNAALDRLAKNLDMSVTTLSAWGNAVEEVGGDAKSVQGTFDMLSKAQTQIRLTGESSLIPFFARLGVNLGAFGQAVRPVDEILLDLSDRFSKMNRTQANNMGRMMGLDQDTLNLLLKGREAVELMIKRQKEHNAVTKAEAEQDAKWQHEIVQLNQTFNKFGRDLLQSAAPALETLIGWLTKFGEWVHANQEFVADFLKVMAVGLGALVVLTAPIDLTVAAVIALGAAIALLYQDYQTWKRGGNSFVDWQIWADRVNAVKEAIQHLKDELKGLEKFEKLFNKIPGVTKLNQWMNPSDDEKKTALKKVLGVTNQGHHKGEHSGDGARAQAERVSKMTGIPADIIWAQWAHETGNFTNRGAKELNNLAGVNVPGGKGQDYRKFSSLDEFGTYYAHLMRPDGLYPKASKAKTADEFAAALKSGGYYSDSQSNYAADMRRYMKTAPGAASALSQASQPGASTTHADNSTSVSTGDINIFTNATDAQGIAKDMKGAVNYLFTSQANSGLT